jgi:hypothetical protein
MACPVPTATTRTAIPVSRSKRGRIASKRPESFVDVVEARVTNGCSWASAAPASRSSAAQSGRRIGTGPPRS